MSYSELLLVVLSCLSCIYAEVTVLKRDQVIYDKTPKLRIRGSGFDVDGHDITLTLGTAGAPPLVVDKDFLINRDADGDGLILKLVSNRKWADVAGTNSSVTLILQAVKFAGNDANQLSEEVAVAKVLAIPTIQTNPEVMYQTTSNELRVSGTGFIGAKKVDFFFSPPLMKGVAYEDVSQYPLTKNEVVLRLRHGYKWRNAPGPLVVIGVDSGGGPVKVNGDEGVLVADVQTGNATVVPEIIPSRVRVYQSALQQAIALTGTGFKAGMSLALDPPLEAGTDYILTIDNKHQARMQLQSGRKWRATSGRIIVKAVTIHEHTYKQGGEDGISIAEVLLDPVVTASTETYHESQSKLITIKGSGFTGVVNTKVTLHPSLLTSYKTLIVTDDQVRLQLQPSQAWLPPAFSLKEGSADAKVALQIREIDTGAGPIILDPPVVVGYIVRDRENVVCDDSCEFAFDGVCDDGSEPKDEYYYQSYGEINNAQASYVAGISMGRRSLRSSGAQAHTQAPRATKSHPKKSQSKKVEKDDVSDGVAYDDYYMENEEYQVSACVMGTDCTDCGGVDAIIDYSPSTAPTGSINARSAAPTSGSNLCTNTCIYSRDGVCDDPRGSKYCELGTDCQDCGPVGFDNFTHAVHDDGWWDDDDDYWTFNDGNFIEKVDGGPERPPSVRHTSRSQTWTEVQARIGYAVGAVVTAGLLYLLHRWYHGQSQPKSVPAAQAGIEFTAKNAMATEEPIATEVIVRRALEELTAAVELTTAKELVCVAPEMVIEV